MTGGELGGRKESQGLKKSPWHLLPYDVMKEVVQVFWAGAVKYEERNWEKGMPYSDVFGAAMRHLTDWWNGEDKDPETGISHLAHAATNILFLLAYQKRKTGKDDRPNV